MIALRKDFAEKIRERMEKFPVEVVRIRCSTGNDWSGNRRYTFVWSSRARRAATSPWKGWSTPLLTTTPSPAWLGNSKQSRG